MVLENIKNFWHRSLSKIPEVGGSIFLPFGIEGKMTTKSKN